MTILDEANALNETLVRHRRFFHENAEVGMDLPIAVAYVKERLIEMGYEPSDCGKSGVTAIVGRGSDGKTFLIRADMDALPIVEESDLEFKSETGNMHACGHDFHTAMLLGAAQILKDNEDKINGRVKLMFQPGEEIIEGARSMINAGLLENPSVDAAMMIHVVTGSEMVEGTALFSTTMSSVDWFEIKVKGKGCHGAMADLGIDPLNILNHIYLSLQALNAREVGPRVPMSLTIGEMAGGTAGNIIPESAYMIGTLRTLNDKTRAFAKERITDISKGIAQTFRGEAEVSFFRNCPVLAPDEALTEQVLRYTQDLLGEGFVGHNKNSPDQGMGSEDFSLISERVPGMLIYLSAGSKENGYTYPIHHPKVMFDECVLPVGAAIYANSALRWLED